MANTFDMILCDTNILIEFLKNNQIIVNNLRKIGTTQIAISHVSAAELYFGAFNKKELEYLRSYLQLIQLVPITTAISNRFLQLMETYSLSHRISIPDALIAATAIELDIYLYTLNKKDFKFIKDLSLWEGP